MPRYYTPKSKPESGGQIRVVVSVPSEPIWRPIGSYNLYKGTPDASGQVVFRGRQTYSTAGETARASMAGREITGKTYE